MRRLGTAALAALVSCASALAAATPAPPPAPTARPAMPATAPAPRPGAPAARTVAPAQPAAAAKPASVPQMWFIAKTGSGAIAYDGYSIKPDPTLGTVKLTSILFTIAPQKSPEGKDFQYVFADDIIDCISGRFQPSSRRLLAADGTVVSRTGATGNNWFPLAENPPLAFLQRIACRGAPLGKSKQVAKLTDALVTMRQMALSQ